ncbi:MAG: Hsp20/alpha crystallin family protein [Deltaproteobacteria bacterium]|nr:Hsp20/alpha crystallin family protein [Deltaproteobacteria bacterium]MBW2446036.1 Hsp20/alpha crystallin family protein [Deltaproteobacteria bacterium]
MDVFETEKSWVVRIAVAGVANRDLRVAVERDVLCVRGVRSPHGRALGGEEVLRHHQLEIEPGPFEARVPIAGAIERDQVEARLEDGVLTVRLPKLPKRAPRRIEVQDRAEPGASDES